MSTCKANNFQIGQSVTATNNFTWYQPASPDGTIRLGVGNAGATTLDAVTVNNSGNVGIGTSSPGQKLEVSGVTVKARLTTTTANTGAAIQFYELGNAAWEIGNSNGANGSFYLKDLYNNAERLVISNSGNLGLGVTPNAWHVNFKALQTGNNYAAFVGDGSNGYAEVLNNCYASGASTYNYVASLAATRYSQQLGSHKWYIAGAGSGGSAISWTQAMTLDASGNLLVGTTNSYAKLYSRVSSGGPAARFDTGYAGDLSQAPVYVLKTDSNSTTSQVFVSFLISGGSAGSGQINANGALSAAFGSFSDARLKENITALPNQLANICALKPSEFDYKDGSGHQIGFIAQEMQEVYPDAVGEGEDGMLTITGWSKTEARLVKAIQELSAELNELKQKVNA